MCSKRVTYCMLFVIHTELDSAFYTSTFALKVMKKSIIQYKVVITTSQHPQIYIFFFGKRKTV